MRHLRFDLIESCSQSISLKLEQRESCFLPLREKFADFLADIFIGSY